MTLNRKIVSTMASPSDLSPASDPSYWRDFNNNAFHKYLGLTLLERRENFGRIQLEKRTTTPGGIGGSVHGGVLATMVDVAAIVAIFGALQPGEQPAGTADLSITYLRQAHGQFITAEATVIKRGRQLATVEIDIVDGEDRLCCKGKVLYAFRANAPSTVTGSGLQVLG